MHKTFWKGSFCKDVSLEMYTSMYVCMYDNYFNDIRYRRTKLYTMYGKTFEGENFHGFCDFLLNRECFTSNNLLAIGIHYQRELQ